MTDSNSSTERPDALSNRLRFVRHVLVAVAIADAAIFVRLGIEYTPWCFIISAFVLTRVVTSKPDDIFNTYYALPTALYFVVGTVFVHTVVLPPLELTFLKLTMEPLQFLWFKVYVGPVGLLSWLIYYFQQPDILKPLLELNPSARKFFSTKTARKYTLVEIGFVIVWLLIASPAHFIMMNNQSLIDRAKSEAAKQIKLDPAVENKFYVEWLSTHNAAKPTKVWGRVSVYDGNTLRSIPVVWSEK